MSMMKRNKFEGKVRVRNIKTRRPKLKILVRINTNLFHWFFHLSTPKGAIEERSWIRLVTSTTITTSREGDVTKSQFSLPFIHYGRGKFVYASCLCHSINCEGSCRRHLKRYLQRVVMQQILLSSACLW